MINVEFSGGLELLFGNQRKHAVKLPANDDAPEASTMKHLIQHLCDNMIDQRKELFVIDGTVRPGILVLINDADWELEGEGNYEIQQGDRILFVSTLHGG